MLTSSNTSFSPHGFCRWRVMRLTGAIYTDKSKSISILFVGFFFFFFSPGAAINTSDCLREREREKKRKIDHERAWNIHPKMAIASSSASIYGARNIYFRFACTQRQREIIALCCCGCHRWFPITRITQHHTSLSLSLSFYLCVCFLSPPYLGLLGKTTASRSAVCHTQFVNRPMESINHPIRIDSTAAALLLLSGTLTIGGTLNAGAVRLVWEILVQVYTRKIK